MMVSMPMYSYSVKTVSLGNLLTSPISMATWFCPGLNLPLLTSCSCFDLLSVIRLWSEITDWERAMSKKSTGLSRRGGGGGGGSCGTGGGCCSGGGTGGAQGS